MEVWVWIASVAAATLTCEVCHSAVDAVNAGVVDLAYPLIEDLAAKLCTKRYPAEACQTGAKGLIDIFLDSLAQKYLDPAYACVLLQACDSPTYSPQNFTQWLEDVYASRPPLTPQVPSSGETFAFAQVTDPHVDFYYVPGTNTQCGEDICCQERFGSGTPGAGFWGDFACDLPVWTFEEALKSLSQEDIEFVVYTGDAASHDIMNQTEEIKVYSIERLSSLFSQYFSVPIYPLLGNNDGSPSEEFNFHNSHWLLDPISSFFTSWLTPQSLQSFQATGSYSQLHLNTTLRIVAVNTQACKNINFYLIANVTDPGGQIQFLYDQLLYAEQHQERVYILGHIPPGSSDCLPAWADHYNAVVARFAPVIAGQFFGHTHSDQFFISTDPMSGEAATVQWVAPSVTTLSDRNPSYRVYTADTGNFEIVDFTQYRMDLETANRENRTEWPPVYSFKSTYNLPDLSLHSILSLADSLSANATQALTYLRNYNAGGPGSPAECDEACLDSLSCQLRSVTYADYLRCVNGTESSEMLVLQEIQGPWTYVMGAK